MARWLPLRRVVTRIVEAGGQILNFRGDTPVGLTATPRIDMGPVAEQPVGLAVEQAPWTVASRVPVGVTASGRADLTSSPPAPVAAQVTPRIDMGPVAHQPVAGRVTHFIADVTRLDRPANVTETSTGGRTDWTNDANATGYHDGTVATITGNAVGSRGGQLELSGYRPVAGKNDMTLDVAELRFYLAVSGTLLNNAEVRLLWRPGSTGAWTVLQTITGDVAALTTPIVHSIRPSLSVPSDLTTIQAAVSMQAAALETYTVQLDAVELYSEMSLLEEV